ncbi:SEC10/PgrA surface exclusion domain-containing protein [uncultured Limosilactobacillus sp.]|uniref:SEC10/PgrA surface exclusion domain-containing protein n=1 Tax=uncultured Limosilactobacillus sp. TaxID=2837629 RepID=UPI002588173A|nr:SEC10/PgrA surface exclusion domain-containing protein [uncultured Limosilactobacillus sp.]
MKKNSVLKTAALVGAMTVTGAVATTTAHADTASATAQQSANTADQQLSNLKSQQTANENQLAARNEAQYNSAANSANSQITKLQDQLKSQQASQAAQDQAALQSGTAQINSATASATASENASYNQVVKDQVAKDNAEIANASKNIVTPAQKAQQESDATMQYNSDKAFLDNTHTSKLNSIRADYEEGVKHATDEAQANQTSAEQQRTQALKDATKAANDAQNKVNNLTQLNQQKQTELTNAKNKLDEAKNSNQQTDSFNNDSYETASDPLVFLNSHTKINLPQGYINTLKYTNQDPSSKDLDLDIQNNHLKNDKDYYKCQFENFSGANQYYTPLHQDDQGTLIPESSKKLTVYAAYLINQLRTQAGYPLVHVNQKYLDYGYQLMHIYNQDMNGEDIDNMNHDAKGFQSFAKTHDIIWIGGTIDGIGLDLSRNFNDAASQVESSIQELLVNDSDEHFGHARTLLGVTDSVDGPYVPYLALNTDKGGNLQIMLFYVRPNATDQAQDLDVSANAVQPNPGKSNTDSAQALKDAQAAYDTAYAAAQASAKDLADAKTELANAQAKLADLQKSQGTSAADQALQAKLNDLAKTRDEAMKQENDSYNTAMNKLNADYQAKLDAIKKLPTNVDELKAQQAARLADMKKAHDQKLADIQANAQKQIAALKDKLAHSHDAENKPLLDQIAKIKADLKAKEANLNAALAELKAHDAAAYAQLKAKLFPTNNAEAAVKGNSNSYVANGSSLRVTFPVNNQTESTNADSNTLPQTGNNNSAAVVALGAIASMLGLGMVAKKREF